jgi:hypothetical protein
MIQFSKGRGLQLTAIVLASSLQLPAIEQTRAGKNEAFPYRLDVEVAFGQDVGSDDVRRSLERQVLREMDAGCFEAVKLQGARTTPGELLLRVVVDGVDRETSYDLSIAARSAPDAPPDAQDAYVTTIEASIRLELLAQPDSILVRRKRFKVLGRHRPSGGEDARAVARQEMIDEVALTSRLWVCKGSPKKLSRQIETALAAAATDDSPR